MGPWWIVLGLEGPDGPHGPGERDFISHCCAAQKAVSVLPSQAPAAVGFTDPMLGEWCDPP